MVKLNGRMQASAPTNVRQIVGADAGIGPRASSARPYNPHRFEHQTKNPQPFVGCGFFSKRSTYRKIYFRMNSTVRTYISGVMFFSLALPVRTLISVQETMPMAMPSEML